MRFLKRLLAFLLVLITFVSSFIGSFQLFTTGTYEYDERYLTSYEEEGSYYLKKAPADIKFCVVTDTEGDGPGFSVVDSEGNIVENRIEKLSEGIFNILSPKGKYTAGKRYTLTLAEGTSFQDENLKGISKLEFYIEREKIEEYTFAENVIQTENILTELDENTVDLSGLTVETGKVVVGQDSNGKSVVYKIDKLNADGTATVSTPAVDEIYSDLNIYGEYEFDVEALTANPDLNIEIAENFKKSEFFNALVMEAYAAPDLKKAGVEVKCIPHPHENVLEIEMKITLEPGENSEIFGMELPDNHSVVIVLNPKIELSADCNIQGLLDWDVAAVVTSTDAWSVQIVNTLDDFEGDTDILSNTKLMKALNQKLSQLGKDVAKGELKLFDWDIPVAPVPGLVFSAEVKLMLEASLAVNLTVGFESTTVYTVGIRFSDYKFSKYTTDYNRGNNWNISLQGKAEIKAGIVLEIQVALFNEKIAYINIDPQVGEYVEAYILLPIVGPQDKKLSGYAEGGIYLAANINAFINFRKKDYEAKFQLAEKKFELFKLGEKEIPIGIVSNAETVRALNNQIIVPDIYFETFDITAGYVKTQKVEFKDLKFTLNDGTPLKISGGKITIPSTVTSGNCYVKATYITGEPAEQKVYTTVFKVMISGCVLEGKVSTYTDESTTAAIEGATVKIKGRDNNTSFTSTVKTDENGRFAFNVQEGDYYLEITADGYRKLTSNQHVTKDEIKYTEHILLMDNAQQGEGKAGGTVTDALTGRGLSGIQIRLREDWNNQNGSYVEGFETVTNANGSYTIENVPVGYYTVEASVDGYVNGYTNVMVLSDNQKMDYDFTITPLLEDGEIRIVLSWGETPRDLDSHLIGRTPGNGTFNVFYSNKVYRYDGREMANLDVDDTTSYGPETITITENIYGTYTYAVHDYTNKSSSDSNKMSFSNAVVRVVTENGQVAEFHVPTDRIGTYWTVFQIDAGGNIVPINTVSNTKPAA